MNMSDYEQYYQRGGTYVLPIEIFNELFGEMENWKKQSNQSQSNWNSLREYLIQLQKLKGINQQCFSWGVAQEVLEKMNELEGKNKQCLIELQ